MTIEERDQEVEEAREKLDDLRWTTCLHCWRGALDALIEAVRRQERERAAGERLWFVESVPGHPGEYTFRARSSEEAGNGGGV